MVIIEVELGITTKYAREIWILELVCTLKEPPVFQSAKFYKNFSHPFTTGIPSLLYLLSTRRGPYHAGPLSYISLMRFLMFSNSSRSSLFSFIFSSTFVTEYMMVVWSRPPKFLAI